MALRAARLLSRQLSSRPLQNAALQRVSVHSQRQFSAAAEEDDIVKQTFVKQQSQFRQFISELSNTTIPVDPSDSKAVADYADALKKIRSKLSVPSYAEKLNNLLEAAAEDSESVRAFLENAKSIRSELGIPDVDGAEKAMYEALDSVEDKLKKPLVPSDTKGMQMWSEALSSVNSKLGISEDQLEKLEEELELDLVKEEVAQYKAEAEEKMNTYKRRDGLEKITVDLKEIDPRAYL